MVFVHASVEGWKKERLFRDEFVKGYYPLTINGRSHRAIAWTTAASVCAVVELVAAGKLPGKGFLKQESIPLQEFFHTANGRLYSEGLHGGSMS